MHEVHSRHKSPQNLPEPGHTMKRRGKGLFLPTHCSHWPYLQSDGRFPGRPLQPDAGFASFRFLLSSLAVTIIVFFLFPPGSPFPGGFPAETPPSRGHDLPRDCRCFVPGIDTGAFGSRGSDSTSPGGKRELQADSPGRICSCGLPQRLCRGEDSSESSRLQGRSSAV